MAALLSAFLLWLFATGNYADWAALLTSPPSQAPAPQQVSTPEKTADTEWPDIMSNIASIWNDW